MTSPTDVIIRQARVVDVRQDRVADVWLRDGIIAQVADTIAALDADTREIDAAGRVLLPGGIDPHVHFNEPGRTDWEGFKTGSQALAKGGVTTFFDMPLNSSPVTTTAAAYDDKRALADAKSQVNAWLWGGLVPGQTEDDLATLAERGVVGFKAFMSDSGLDEFPAVDDYTLYRGMQQAAALDKTVAVHAENDTLTRSLAQAAQAVGRTGMADYLMSRPVIAECEAIQRAILFAEETGCALHIVHVSSGRGVALVAEARQRGVDVTCETCPHYLTLTTADVIRIGAAAKCAPPIRSAEVQTVLWERLLAGDIDMIASDHSPAPPELKTSDDFFAVWGGIAGCQSTLSLLLTHGYHQRGMSLQQISALTSHNVAARFGLSNKGLLAEGMDADCVLVDLDAVEILHADDLEYRHPISPYIGMELQGRVDMTWVAGEVVYEYDG